MGKNKDKKQQAADARWRTGQINKQEIEALNRYGIDRKDYGYDADGDEGSHLKGDWGDMRQELANRAMNDYDTRRTFEASALTGNEKSREYAENGFADATNVVNAFGHLKDLKQEHIGGGGMNGAKNIAGLTHKMVQEDRDQLNTSIDDRLGALSVEDQMDQDKGFTYSGPDKEVSPEMQQAKEKAQSWQKFSADTIYD